MRWRSWGWVVMLAVLGAPAAHAHGGGLNRDGCHNDRRNGGYHCHRGAPATRAQARFSYSASDANAYVPARAQRHAPASGSAYRNCTEARAAGAAPVRRGDPGYGPHLDRDNDGIGCEPYRGR
ncbi:excalibur calcium-binding domain-containing protein [Lysobacter sp. Root604]|uniref:excalibur calcium-binding domain-containing protein n=1 Tax=Lysobacter sp. Root604 TaxID=1736568 RepID=UPI000A55B91E|nr:excalibur calcium-binding domain-containing protein [Lysobacter sp. Root604]